MIPTLPSEVDRQLLAEQCRRSFAVFVQRFWAVCDPYKLVWNWHIQAICDHLQAVTEGTISNLVICVPPGHAKSMLVSVLWQPWQWIDRPHIRELYGSYDENLTYRDSIKSKDVVKSARYQRVFRPDWKIRMDVDSKGYYANTAHGSRRTYYMGSTHKTGWRGDHVIVDDPLSAEDRYNRRKKLAVVETWDKVLSTRVNPSGFKPAFVVIMQRLADDDLVGHIMENYSDQYEFLIMPSYFEPDSRCRTSIFEDPRAEEGELLFPQLYPAAELERLHAVLGEVDFSAQHQHRPYREGGNRFNSGQFQYWDYAQAGNPYLLTLHHRVSGAVEQVRSDRLTRFLTADVATSEATENDWTSVGTWLMTKKMEIVLLDRVKLQGEEPAVVAAIKGAWHDRRFGRSPPATVYMERNGPGGAVAQHLRSEGISVTDIPISRDKIVMSAPAVVRIEGGQVFFPDPDIAPWMHDFSRWVIGFPGARWDDDVTMLSLAANSVYESDSGHIVGFTPVKARTGADVNRLRASEAATGRLFGRR